MEIQTAEQALSSLKTGNERNQTARAEGAGRDTSRRRELLDGQHPFAIVLSCADSRIVPEIIFDTGIGDLFVIRVAGNVANTSSIASIEYAVAHLGTKLVVVLGHESCGAVTAALEGGDPGENLSHLLAHIQPAVDASDEKDVDATARHNAKLTADRLTGKSDIISRAVETDGLRIVSAFYQLESGSVDFD
jgi:carbonic anhydrase